ncbi:MAG: alpha-mannosidase [Armatimonadia bacterium]|nr:alpha-mannosidase [Armatimonadia bacterium]
MLVSQRGKLYLIGNAHIDPVWLWQWPEGREEVLSTCRTALELMQEDDTFVFCRSSAATYEWIEEYDPELLEAIAQRIEEGRWVVVGGWWVQPDCNVPSGESLVRQALLGKRYFLDRFGVDVTVGYNVDTFGHPAGLPQILVGAGQGSYCFFRPGPHEKSLPSAVFRWRAPDGSEVMACRPPGHYNTGPEDIEERVREAAAAMPPPLESMLCFFGVGNHGGGPTRENLASIRRLRDDPRLPDLVMGGIEDFFAEAAERRDAWPIVEEELQYHARGCYSAVSEVKRDNRQVEHLLLATERLVSAARLQGIPLHADEDLRDGWKLLLFNQFHDILAGTSLRVSYDDTRADHAEAKLLAGRHLRRALHRLAARVDTSGEGQPVVVFNPSLSPRREVVELDIAFRGSEGEVSLVDDSGAEVPAMLLDPTVHTSGRTHTAAFLADMPALGHRTYRLINRAPQTAFPSVEISPTSLESRHLRVELDSETGWIRSIYDKRHDVELCAGPANVPLVLSDPSDTWSHGVDAYRDELGAFRLIDPPEVFVSGPTHGILRLRLAFETSVIEQFVVLYQDIPQIAFRTAVDWRQRHQVLKVAFPFAVHDPVATFETAYGHTVRAGRGDEQPHHRWLDVSGTAADQPYGAAVLNDGCYGCDVLGSEARLTLLRSPIYAFHDPQEVQPDELYEYTDQGVRAMTYAVAPHAGDWRGSGVETLAASLNSPCFCLVEPPHGGPAPPTESYVSVGPDHVTAEVLKPAEDGAGLVLRAYEREGRSADLEVELLGERVEGLSLQPYQIGTWRLTRQAGGWRAEPCDLLERPLGQA